MKRKGETMNNVRTKQLNTRVMVVFLMIFSAAILPFSGLLMHESANHHADSLHWVTMGLHNVASIIFTLAVLIHVKFNLKAILNYIRDKKEKVLHYPKEMVIAGTALAIMLLLVTAHVVSQHL
jgi:uncharacterized membrane protein